MRKLNHRTLRARALEAKEVTSRDLQWIADNAERIAARYNDELDDIIRGRGYDGDGRGGNDLTGPEAAVDARMPKNPDGSVQRDQHGKPVVTDPEHTLRRTIAALLGSIDLAGDSATAARTQAGKLTTSTDIADRQQQHLAVTTIGGRGHCDNCNRWCEGTRNDRLITPTTSDTNRAGAIAQCHTCLVYWQRNGELRPPKLWNVDELSGAHGAHSPATDAR